MTEWVLVSSEGSYRRAFHFSPKQGHLVDFSRRRVKGDCTLVEYWPAPGGAAEVGHTLSQIYAGKRLAVAIAGNNGRPGGTVGGLDGCRVEHRMVKGDHHSQEEDIVSDWLITETNHWMQRSQTHKDGMGFKDKLFGETISRRWGMEEPNSTSVRTIQCVDYTKCRDPQDYANAWVVQSVRLSPKHGTRFDTTQQFRADLVFVAGPNAGCSGTGTDSTTRTLDKEASQNYTNFEQKVKSTLRTALDAMIVGEIEIAMLALVSSGVYAGGWRDRLSQIYTDPNACATGRMNRTKYMDLVDDVLKEPVGPRNEWRGQYFEHVVLAGLTHCQQGHSLAELQGSVAGKGNGK